MSRAAMRNSASRPGTRNKFASAGAKSSIVTVTVPMSTRLMINDVAAAACFPLRDQLGDGSGNVEHGRAFDPDDERDDHAI